MISGREHLVPYSIDRLYVSKKELQIKKLEHKKLVDAEIQSLRQEISLLSKDWSYLIADVSSYFIGKRLAGFGYGAYKISISKKRLLNGNKISFMYYVFYSNIIPDLVFTDSVRNFLEYTASLTKTFEVTLEIDGCLHTFQDGIALALLLMKKGLENVSLNKVSAVKSISLEDIKNHVENASIGFILQDDFDIWSLCKNHFRYQYDFDSWLRKVNTEKLQKYLKAYLGFHQLFGGSVLDPISLKLDEEKTLQAILEGGTNRTILGHRFELNYSINDKEFKAEDTLEYLENELLQCDKIRADLDVYAPECLHSISQGHWDLCDSGKNYNDYEILSLPTGETLVARPPWLDVNRSMVCGIDFGTKSTIVACRDKQDHLLKIGTGKLNKEPESADYENPTVLEIVSLDEFLQAYRECEGRPNTLWRQIKVAHEANQDMLQQNQKLQTNITFLSDLKQWVGNNKMRLSLQGQLKAYGELQDGDFDPIEIYAYYLGLYINRMLQGICLHYALSYPVTFNEETRERMLCSFRRGLKKSLPELVQQHPDFDKYFKVYTCVSEPAAYAMAALQEYNLLPKSKEECVCYGVFDFGGGTTDFDFGYVKRSKNPQAWYQLNHFGGAGDDTLGGENLLQLLAYALYKENFKLMLKEEIEIIRPFSESSLNGMEGLIQTFANFTPYAYINLKVIAEALRPLWEESEFKLPKDNLVLNLKDKAGTCKLLNLVISVDKLTNILKQKLEWGVDNFIRSMRKSGIYDEKYDVIHILLAGNGSRSSLLLPIFNKKLGEEAINYLDKETEIFKVEASLGNQSADKSLANLRTCKTGVAFGLLDCYKGSRKYIVVNEERENFRFFIGGINYGDNCFKVIKLSEKGEWVKLQSVFGDEEQFDLYYSTQPRALTNSMQASEVERISCYFKAVSELEELCVFVAPKDRTRLKYVIGTEAEYEKDSFAGEIYEVELE